MKVNRIAIFELLNRSIIVRFLLYNFSCQFSLEIGAFFLNEYFLSQKQLVKDWHSFKIQPMIVQFRGTKYKE